MPVTPISMPVNAPHIYVPMNRPRSDAEIMQANGGHLYREVHLAQCAECRAYQKLHDEQDAQIGIFVLEVFLGLVVLGVLLYHKSEMVRWFKQKLKKFLLRERGLRPLDAQTEEWKDWDKPGPEKTYEPTACQRMSLKALDVVNPGAVRANIGDCLYPWKYRGIEPRFIFIAGKEDASYYCRFTHDQEHAWVKAFRLPDDLNLFIREREKTRANASHYYYS